MKHPTETPTPSSDALKVAWIVLDTNVVFDWLVFGNAECVPLNDAILSRRIRWVATPAMRDEHFHVIRRGVLDTWHPDLPRLSHAWDAHCTLVDLAPLGGQASRLRCSDEDDQKFIDLALGHPARWLLSKDKAVLRLAKRIRTFGPEVLTPAMWASTTNTAGASQT